MATARRLASGATRAPRVARSAGSVVGRWVALPACAPAGDPAAGNGAANGHGDGDGDGDGEPAGQGAVRAWLAQRGSTVVGRRVLVRSKGRPVVQYRFRPAGEPSGAAERTLVAKGYNRGDGAATFAAMEHLWSAGFSDDLRLSIPEPFAYLPGPRLLLQSTAPGGSLYRYLDDPEAGMEAVRLTGRWLAKLHTTSPPPAPPVEPESEAVRLARFCDALTVANPRMGARVRAIAAGVALAAPGATGPLVPTHGDFQAKNVHVSRRRVTVIDLDRFAMAEPARDVGHFVAQSMTMSYVRTGSFDAIQAWNQAFLEEYARTGPPGALAGLPVAVVRSMLEILYYKLVVRPVRDASFLDHWLDECDRCLEPVAP